MNTSRYIKTNAYGSSIVILAVVFLCLWLLTGCASPSSDRAVHTKVLGERVERTATTTEYVPPTTTTVYVPPPTAAPSPSPADRAYALLITDIPVLARNTRADVEDMLGTVCEVIDEQGGDFDLAGSVIVASSVGSFDFDYGDAGTILGAAVVIRCPEWASAAADFAGS
jgi:hypothetical protein